MYTEFVYTVESAGHEEREREGAREREGRRREKFRCCGI